MDIDHEAKKHKVPRSAVAGEAKRTAAEDPSDQIQDVLEDAKDAVDQKDADDRSEPKGERARSHGRGDAEAAPERAERSPRTEHGKKPS
jgi:hypothetical protein